MALPPHWHGHAKLIYSLGWRFDPELPFLAKRIMRGAVLFDIGANVGTWSLILSDAVGPSGMVCAFEPAKGTYDTLSRNIVLNTASNIRCFQCALADAESRLRLYHDVDCSRNSLGQTRNADHADYEEVASRTLDGVVEDIRLDRLDFMKLDVEGAEPLVLNGALRTLHRFKPVVLFEVNPAALGTLGFTSIASWRILSDYDYRFYELQSEQLRERQECPSEMTNIWAVHPDCPWTESLGIRT